MVNITSGDGDLRPVVPPSTEGALKQGTILGYATSKAALNRMANALAPDLLADHIAVVNVEPGFTRTEMVDLLGDRGLVDADQAAPMDLPVRTILDVLLDDDPMRLTGQIVRAQPDQAL